MSAPAASIVLPISNAGPLLDDVLAGIAAQASAEGEARVAHEVVLADLGSTDGSLERARRWASAHTAATGVAVQVVEVPREHFGHGRARNYAAEHTHGEVLVFLTHDATPASPRWLYHHVRHYADPKVGLVFGPQLPRPDASPVTRAEQLGFFAEFAEGGETTVYACEAGEGVTRSGAADSDLVRFASNANTSYRRSAWEKTHFREVSYAEDQLMAMDLAAAGWRKVYEPRAAVYHSHNFGVVETFQRYVDDWAGMQRSFGHVEVKRLWHLPVKVAYQSRVYMKMLGADESLSAGRRLVWAPRVVLQGCSRQVGGYIGPRFDRLPTWAQEVLSREARLRRKKIRGQAELRATTFSSRKPGRAQ